MLDAAHHIIAPIDQPASVLSRLDEFGQPLKDVARADPPSFWMVVSVVAKVPESVG